MFKAVVFAGTSEGRQVSEYLAGCSVDVCMCVATDYGEKLATGGQQVHTGRMDAAQMTKFIQPFDFVVDATHPYAREVTQNICRACEDADKAYYRLERPQNGTGGCVAVQTVAQAVEYLRETTGNILITTGSKDLAQYAPLMAHRLFPRVLPTAESLAQCEKLGIPQKNIICMQGPFTQKINEAMLEMTGARYLVTKDSGNAGGCGEKLDAAQAVGATVVMIGRPAEHQGHTLSGLKQLLHDRYGIKPREHRLFPLFVNLAGKQVVVFGSGEQVTEQIKILRSFECSIRVVAESIQESLQNEVVWEQRGYRAGDCAGADIVLAATGERQVNAAIAAECGRRNIPVTVGDDAEESTFYFPEIVTENGVVAGVAASGENRELAKRAVKNIQKAFATETEI